MGYRLPIGKAIRARRIFGKEIDLIGTLYVTGNVEERRVIGDGLVEHLLEIDGMEGLFSSWRNHPLLAAALGEALAWASFVTKKRKFLETVGTSFLKAVHDSQVKAVMRAPELGTDTVALDLIYPEGRQVSLVLNCAPEVLQSLESLPPISAALLSRISDYILDEKNWGEDEYDPFTSWVTLGINMFKENAS